MRWLREAISDRDGLADMAYISIGALTVAAIAALVFIFAMSIIAWNACEPVANVTTDVQQQAAARTVEIKRCGFDPLPVGQAVGLIFGAFGALIGALAGYMAATRRAAPGVRQRKAPK
jgi:hypothetical protein